MFDERLVFIGFLLLIICVICIVSAVGVKNEKKNTTNTDGDDEEETTTEAPVVTETPAATVAPSATPEATEEPVVTEAPATDDDLVPNEGATTTRSVLIGLAVWTGLSGIALIAWGLYQYRSGFISLIRSEITMVLLTLFLVSFSMLMWFGFDQPEVGQYVLSGAAGLFGSYLTYKAFEFSVKKAREKIQEGVDAVVETGEQVMKPVKDKSTETAVSNIKDKQRRERAGNPYGFFELIVFNIIMFFTTFFGRQREIFDAAETKAKKQAEITLRKSTKTLTDLSKKKSKALPEYDEEPDID